MKQQDKTQSNTEAESTSEETPSVKEESKSAPKNGSEFKFKKSRVYAENLYMGSSSRGSREPEDKIDNYIRNFTPSKDITALNGKDQVTFYTSTLLKERILLVDSFDEDVMLKAVATIADNNTFQPLEKKRLNFDKGDKTRTDIYFQTIVDDYISKKKDLLLTIFLNNHEGSQNFFKHLLSNDFKTALGSYQQILTERKCYIIVAIAVPESIKALDANGTKLKGLRMNVPYLENKLLDMFGETEGRDLYERLDQQRKNGKWSRSEEDFFREMERILSEKSEVRRLIDEADNSNDQSTFGNIIARDNDEAIRLVNDEDILIRYISFIAVNFTNLSISEFQFVAQVLLNDKAKSEIVPNPVKAGEFIEKLLIDRWNNSSDILIRKLRLKESSSSQHDGRILTFEIQGFHEIFKERFSTTWSWFSHQQFNYLFFDKGLLFRHDTPYRVFENVIHISAEIARHDPEVYCRKLLIYLTFTVINQEAKVDIKINPYVDDLEDAFEKYLQKLEESKFEFELQKLEAFRKIGLLLAEMHKFDNLRDRIGDFFHLLMGYSFHQTVFFFVRFLRNVPDFTTLFWIRLLLDKSPFKIKKETYFLLVTFLSENSSSQVLDNLKKIKEWFTGKATKTSYSYNAGLCVLRDYLFVSIQKLDRENYGKFPSQVHLFSRVENTEEGKQVLEFVIEWLLTPGLKEAFITVDSFLGYEEEPDFYEKIFPHIIILLKASLNGSYMTGIEELPKNTSIELGENLTEIVRAKATKTQIQELKSGFRNWRDQYIVLRQTDESSKETRDTYYFLSRISAGLLNSI